MFWNRWDILHCLKRFETLLIVLILFETWLTILWNSLIPCLISLDMFVTCLKRARNVLNHILVVYRCLVFLKGIEIRLKHLFRHVWNTFGPLWDFYELCFVEILWLCFWNFAKSFSCTEYSWNCLKLYFDDFRDWGGFATLAPTRFVCVRVSTVWSYMRTL